MGVDVSEAGVMEYTVLDPDTSDTETRESDGFEQFTDTWQDLARCKGVPELFFAPPAERPERRAEREAAALSYCMACPALLVCRRSARDNREHGFWGGENDEQRAAAGFMPRSPSRRAVLQAGNKADAESS